MLGTVSVSLLLLLLSSLLALFLLDRDRIPYLRFQLSPLREVPLWRGAEVMVCFVIFFLVNFGLSEALAQGHSEAGPRRAWEQTVVQVGSFGSACAFALWTVRDVHGQPLAALGLRASATRNLLVVLVLYVLSFSPLEVVYLLWTSGLEQIFGLSQSDQQPVELFRETIASGDLGSVLLLLGGGLIVAPVGEEIIFRGFLFGLLRARWGFGPALVVSSAVFAVLHPPIFAMCPIFFVGALLCYVYERTGSLYSAITYHLVFNAASFVRMVSQEN